MPFQKYATSAACAAEDRPLTGSKKRFIDSVNRYDHNILGLSRRAAVAASSLTPGVRTCLDVPASSSRVRENGKGIDAHKVCHLGYLAAGDSDTCGGSRKFSGKSETSSRNSGVTSLSESEQLNPREFCAGCYNCRLSEKKQLAKERKGRYEDNEEIVRRLKEEHELSRQQEKERKLLEKEALTKSPIKYGDKHAVTPKVTEETVRPEEKYYSYRGYGTDHPRRTEEMKERNRERMRRKVEKQVEECGNREKEKLLNLDVKAGGNLDIPSFRKRKPDKEKYKKELLNQMEGNKQRRIKARENDKKNNGVIIESLAKGEYVDRFAEQRAGLKEEYYKSVKDIQNKKLQQRREKERETQEMNEGINKYQQQLKSERAKKQVSRSITLAQCGEVGGAPRQAGGGLQP